MAHRQPLVAPAAGSVVRKGSFLGRSLLLHMAPAAILLLVIAEARIVAVASIAVVVRLAVVVVAPKAVLVEGC